MIVHKSSVIVPQKYISIYPKPQFVFPAGESSLTYEQGPGLRHIRVGLGSVHVLYRACIETNHQE